jgi:trigger factor
MIKKFYGKQIERDAMSDIAADLFNKIFHSEKLSFIGEPKLISTDKIENEYKFLFEYEIVPVFDLADYHGINIDEPVHRVTDEEIGKEIEQICLQFGKLEEADQITDDLHVANTTIQEIDESGLPIIGAKTENPDIFLQSPYLAPDLKALFINLKVGDSFTHIQPAQQADQASKRLSFTINNIKKLVPAEFNDSLAETYTGGKFTLAQDLKDEIGFELQEQWNQKSREAMEDQIVQKMVEMNGFEAPKGVVRNVVAGMLEDVKKKYKDVPQFQKATVDEFYDQFEDSAIFRVKWEIIRSKVIEKEDLKVEEYDLDPFVEEEAARRKSDPEKIREELKENQNVIATILYKKVVDVILDFAITNEVEFDSQGHYHADGADHHHHDHDNEEDHHHSHDHEHEHQHDEIENDKK